MCGINKLVEAKNEIFGLKLNNLFFCLQPLKERCKK